MQAVGLAGADRFLFQAATSDPWAEITVDTSQQTWRVATRTRVETFIACTEADFENRPCVRKNCAKFVRGALPTGPRKFVRKMCGGIRKCAEIVRNLCGGAPAQFARNIGVGLPRMCVHKFRAFFRQNLSFSLRPSCTGKKCLKTRENFNHGLPNLPLRHPKASSKAKNSENNLARLVSPLKKSLPGYFLMGYSLR